MADLSPTLAAMVAANPLLRHQGIRRVVTRDETEAEQVAQISAELNPALDREDD